MGPPFAEEIELSFGLLRIRLGPWKMGCQKPRCSLRYTSADYYVRDLYIFIIKSVNNTRLGSERLLTRS